MCGIAGIVTPGGIDPRHSRLDGLSTALKHRGPDDVGFLMWNGALACSRSASDLPPGTVALVHRRLSIIDLTDAGWQPMVDASGRYAIVFNGEIYNHVELRHELTQDGVRFRSHCDTEVLLQLLMRRGVDGLRSVVGMFAFGFLDIPNRSMWLGRDPFGIKPLFFTESEGAFAFSSELRPLLEMGFARRTVDPKGLFDYLRHAVTDHDERTVIEGVRQLKPAHACRVRLDTGRVDRPVRYWQPSIATGRPRPRGAAAEELAALFSESVRLHLRADVPLAATLSGGIDSTAIVSEARRSHPATPLTVFSYIADDALIGEERYVDAAAQPLALEARKIRLDPDALVQELDSLILQQEQPFTTTSIWAQSRVFRRIHDDGYKVVLDGQGADELFAGYPVFRAAKLARLLKRGRFDRALRLVASMPQPRLASVLQAAGTLLPRGAESRFRRIVGRPQIPAWLNAEWVRRHGIDPGRPFAPTPGGTELTASLYDATVATSLPMLLRYADRNAMAVSLENRVPFLTTALAEFALSLGDDYLIGEDGTTKRLLREALKGVVPEVILNRRDKIGFVTPEKRWFDESAGLRAALRAVAAAPLLACFAPALGDRLAAVAEGRAPYDAVVWRSWNAIRWTQLLKLELPA